MSKRKRNLQIAEFYRNKPCLVCGKEDGTIAGDHIKEFGAGGECIHENMWSLCWQHHEEKGKSLIRFAEKYERIEAELISKGWKLDKFMHRWTMITDKGWDE